MTLKVIQLLPPGERQTPGGNGLEERRLARVVRSGDHNMAGKDELHALEALEPFNQDAANDSRHSLGLRECLHHEELVPTVVNDFHRNLSVFARFERRALCAREVLPHAVVVVSVKRACIASPSSCQW